MRIIYHYYVGEYSHDQLKNLISTASEQSDKSGGQFLYDLTQANLSIMQNTFGNTVGDDANNENRFGCCSYV